MYFLIYISSKNLLVNKSNLTKQLEFKLAVTLGKGAVIAGAGMGVCYLTGYGMTVAVKDLKADTKLVKKVAFKWTDTKKLNYSVRIQCWNEYNGKKISSTKTYYRTGSYRQLLKSIV